MSNAPRVLARLGLNPGVIVAGEDGASANDFAAGAQSEAFFHLFLMVASRVDQAVGTPNPGLAVVNARVGLACELSYNDRELGVV